MKQTKFIPLIGLGLTLFLSKPHTIYGNTVFGGGGGMDSDAYRLSTPEHLTELQVAVDGGGSFSGEYFVLTNDIDLEGYMITIAIQIIGIVNKKSSIWKFYFLIRAFFFV